MSISPTLSKNEKIEHHIRIKTYTPIILKFLVENGVNFLCVDWTHVHWC